MIDVKCHSGLSFSIRPGMTVKVLLLPQAWMSVVLNSKRCAVLSAFLDVSALPKPSGVISSDRKLQSISAHTH